MKKFLLSLLAGAAIAASATTFTVNELNYTVIGNNRVEVSGLADNTVTTLDIPATVENGGVTYNVTAIGDEAFRWAKVISVNLPASIDTLRHGAFNGSDLVSINLNEGLKYIGENALACKNLTTIDIPASVETIGGSAFFAASALATVTMHDGLKTIGKSAFYNSGLTSVVIPATVDSIAGTAFLNCRKLTSATINEGSLRYLGDGAFNGCKLLESITLPATVEYIGLEAFLDDAKLATINIPAGVKTLGESFMAKTGIETINLDPANENYQLIDGVLYNKAGNILIAVTMKGLTELVIPDAVQGIYGGAFWGSQVADVTLPDGLVIIDDYAFCQSALAHIQFPE
ncbi:MAG: leucine-rich repeat protein, partial [Muribaculaceae bacterium]|nr:leucine-rich repeat protein [Muribaculaceae bacterium]